jgi:two-component system, LytTR family, sensor kinase
MKKERNILLGYWILYYGLISLIEAGPDQYYFDSFTSNLISLPLKLFFVSIVTGPFITGYLLKRQPIKFFISYFSLLALFTVVLRLIDNHFVLEYVLTNWVKQPIFSSPPLLYNMIKLQFVAAIPFAIKLFSYWMETEAHHKQLLQEQTEAKLNSLRDQIRPHFLFNALNTIYSKTITNPSLASELVLKICSLLRASLYEHPQSPIPVSTELEYLNNYIDLQKMRFQDTVDISFSVFGTTKSERLEPFLILPWIENAFKHCLPDRQGNRWITIQMVIAEGFLVAQIDNSCQPKEKNKEVPEGIGNVNVKKRLELLYPMDHLLKCRHWDDNYYVYLKIPLL